MQHIPGTLAVAMNEIYNDQWHGDRVTFALCIPQSSSVIMDKNGREQARWYVNAYELPIQFKSDMSFICLDKRKCHFRHVLFTYYFATLNTEILNLNLYLHSNGRHADIVNADLYPSIWKSKGNGTTSLLSQDQAQINQASKRNVSSNATMR